MAAQINLVPKTKEVSKSAQKVSGVLTKAVYAVMFLFLAVSLGGGALYFFTSRNLSDLKSSESELETNISSLQATEESLIRLKDRLEKINTLLVSRSVEGMYEKQQALVSISPVSTKIQQVKIDTANVELELLVSNSSDLDSLINSVKSSNSFNSANIKDLAFQPLRGYMVDLILN